jgi:hypothetical protein
MPEPRQKFIVCHLFEDQEEMTNVRFDYVEGIYTNPVPDNPNPTKFDDYDTAQEACDEQEWEVDTVNTDIVAILE